MVTLHALGFDAGWPGADMAAHVARDIVLGTGSPLTGLIIIRAIEDQAEILTLTTRPDMRGQGLARSLLDAGESQAGFSGVDIMFLEVAEDNEAAINLYKRAGYEAFGRRPAYYRRMNGRVAALTFRKKLDARGASG